MSGKEARIDDALDQIMSDGQPVFRHIDKIRNEIDIAISQQKDRVEAAEFLDSIDYVYKDCDPIVTGRNFREQEVLAMSLLTTMKKMIDDYYNIMKIE